MLIKEVDVSDLRIKIPSENSCIILKTSYRKYFLIIIQYSYLAVMLVYKYSLVEIQRICYTSNIKVIWCLKILFYLSAKFRA